MALIPVQRAEAAVAVHGSQSADFLRAQFEIKDLEVFLDAALSHRLGNNNHPSLNLIKFNGVV